jgi:hypothetical protein
VLYGPLRAAFDVVKHGSTNGIEKVRGNGENARTFLAGRFYRSLGGTKALFGFSSKKKDTALGYMLSETRGEMP